MQAVMLKQSRGFTLIEVMVSLAIISLALITSISLVMLSLNLEISSRQRTEATALGQRYMATTIQLLKGDCTLSVLPTTNEYSPSGLVVAGSSATFNVKVSGDDAFAAINGSLGSQINSASFKKLTVTVSWPSKLGGSQTIVLTQYVRR